MDKKINKLRIIAFNGITDIEISPTSNTIIISGDNGAGKTSILEAINTLIFGGRLTDPVVKSGESRSNIIAEIGNYIISWVKTIKSPPKIEIKSKSGERIGHTRSVLSDIIGAKLLADPLNLMNETDEKKQRKMFLDLLGIDTTRHDEQEKYRMNKRQDIGVELRGLKERLKSCSYDPDTTTRVSLMELTDQLRAIQNKKTEHTIMVSELEAMKKKYKENNAEIERLQQENKELREAAKPLEEKISQYKPVDTQLLEAKIKDAELINERYRANQEYKEVKKSMERKEDEYTAETEEIESIRKGRNELLSSANLPDTGITITDERILLNNLPMCKASTGQKIKAGFEFLLALDPEFKVLWIEDGDKLDSNNLSLIKELSEKKNIQVWIERVGNVAGSIFLENGSIKDTGKPNENN
jgi:recombinational DNA repair ATPase RecF